MNTEHPEATDAACEVSGPSSAACGSRGRRVLMIVFLLLIVFIIGGTWLVIEQIGGKLRSTEVYQTAMAKIEGNPDLVKALGAPITAAWRTAGRMEEHEVDLRFSVFGSQMEDGKRAEAKVYALGRRIQGKWALNVLDVTVDKTGLKLNLLENEEGGAPLFQPPAAKPAETPKPVGDGKPAGPGAVPSGPAMPDINIKLPAPPGDVPK